jgi:hypothetical protein
MTYDNFTPYPFDPFMPLIAVGLMLAIFAFVFCVIESLQMATSRRKSRWCGISALIILGGVVASIAGLCSVGDEVTAKNKVTAEHNLKKKYDIEAVLWNKSQASAASTDLNKIAVQDKESNILIFQYRVDKETHEPFLLNDSGNAQIKANDLLLDK